MAEVLVGRPFVRQGPALAPGLGDVEDQRDEQRRGVLQRDENGFGIGHGSLQVGRRGAEHTSRSRAFTICNAAAPPRA